MNKDLLSYSILLLGSLFFLSMTLNMPVTSVTVINSALFPRLVLYGLIFLSGLGMYNALRRKKAESAGKIRAPLYLCCACLLVFIWVGPYLAACRRAFYIERKREALMDEDVIPDDFGRKVKPEKVEKSAKAEEKAE